MNNNNNNHHHHQNIKITKSRLEKGGFPSTGTSREISVFIPKGDKKIEII